MPAVRDFRVIAGFDLGRVNTAGRDIGTRVYWKLYAVENMFRIIIHSVLSAQIDSAWWTTATNPALQKKAQGFRSRYTASPWHTSPGSHGIYYVDFADLNEIIRANSNLFLPIVPDIDQWIARIEQVRLPRNVVAHMNWPNDADRKRIDLLFDDVQVLSSSLAAKIQLRIP